MISALMSFCAIALSPTQAEYEVVELWTKTVDGATRVQVVENYVVIGEEKFNPVDGQPFTGQSDSFTLTEKMTPDVTMDRADSLRELLFGYIVFYNGEDHRLALGGPVNSDGVVEYVTTLAKLDMSGEVVAESFASTPTHGLYTAKPVELYSRIEQGYFLLDSYPMLNERGSRYHSIILAEPLGLSPLRVIYYFDLSNPRRAIGVYQDNMRESVNNSSYLIEAWAPLVCGDIYTGRVYWVLEYKYQWAQRVGGHILSYDMYDRSWCILREEDGVPIALDATLLDRTSPSYRTKAYDGVLVVVRRFPVTSNVVDYWSVTAYTIEERK